MDMGAGQSNEYPWFFVNPSDNLNGTADSPRSGGGCGCVGDFYTNGTISSPDANIIVVDVCIGLPTLKLPVM